MTDLHTDAIQISGARENNLKNVSVHVPKKKITVFTGVSGSGKSSLCLDTIAAESRRELNETFPSFVQQYLPKYGRPDVDGIKNLPVTIVIDQKKPAANARSTVGTYTDIYALLRLLFSRIGQPFVGYSDSFSFNHPAGRCPRCDGLGEVTELDIHKLVDFDKCLNDEGVIQFPAFTTGAWRWKRYAWSGLFDMNKKIRDYAKEELDLLLYSPQIRLKDPPEEWPKSAKYEGIYPRMYRSIIGTKEGKKHQKILNEMVSTFPCPDCRGARLNKKILSCRINGLNIAEVTNLPIPETTAFIEKITDPLAREIRRELIRRLKALHQIGLSYLSLSRGTGTLSGGEAQRIKIAKYIHSALTDMAYVLDEPSAGLHPLNIDMLQESLLHLRDQGNTILIVEHHREVIQMADHIIDMGPGAGKNGGTVMFTGSFPELLSSGNLTGKLLGEKLPLKENCRRPKDWFTLQDAGLHNLKNVTVQLPLGVMTVVAGVAGSGKSSLMECFQDAWKGPMTAIGQKDIGINLRSTPATYLDIANPIRHIFATANHVSPALFSFNSKGGCRACGGRGVIVSDMAFMDSIETVCEACHGKRYDQDVLQYQWKGMNIAEVMSLTVEEALALFAEESFRHRLKSLSRVGLHYLHLNQAMTTLSGGELQRVKLADRLDQKETVYILDEPTSGLHLEDTRKLILLFQELVDAGNSLFVVEHSLEVLKQADYVIEMGPGGGGAGGELLYAGTPEGMLGREDSITGPYLRNNLPESTLA